jgi:hypothetical protein
MRKTYITQGFIDELRRKQAGTPLEFARPDELLQEHFGHVAYDKHGWFYFDTTASGLAVTQITLAVVHRLDRPLPEDLDDVLRVCDTGNAVGDVISRQTEEVTGEAAGWWLRRLGNDGSFFEEEEGDGSTANP